MNQIFKLKTLTPIWTGGIDRDSNQIHETGILGSLRWWYEGIVRGMGGYACDPTDNPCEYSEQKKKKICAVCELFGCTGLSRRFKVKINNLGAIPLFFVSDLNVYQSNGNWLFRVFGGQDLGGTKSGKGYDTKFTFGVKSLWSSAPFDVIVTTLRGDQEEAIDIISYLLSFIAAHGGIGAKTQYGFGQIAVVEGIDRKAIDRGNACIQKAVNSGESGKRQKSYFSTSYFFSNLYSINTSGYADHVKLIGTPPQNLQFRSHFIPCAYDIRYKSMMKHPITGKGKNFGIRPFLKEKITNINLNSLLGNSNARRDDERSATKINVSHLIYDVVNRKYQLKIWGYVLPDLGPSVGTVETTINDFILNHMFPQSQIVQSYHRGSNSYEL